MKWAIRVGGYFFIFAFGILLNWGWKKAVFYRDFDPGCNVNYPEHDPSSRWPQAGDVVEWRCMSDGIGHLRLMARVKP